MPQLDQNTSMMVGILITFFSGFVAQYLRAFPKFNDTWTGAYAVVAGAGVTLLISKQLNITEPLTLALLFAQYVQQVYGGVMGGHTAAQHTPLVPKFNSAA